ncbi:hypothetical protein STIAU_0114, partial [Stigmatella aurantiaca DW4/3-1]
MVTPRPHRAQDGTGLGLERVALLGGGPDDVHPVRRQ